MPPPALIASQRRRDRVIAAIMACVLLLSLAAAYGVTLRRGGQTPLQLATIQLKDLSFSLPKSWRQDDPARYTDPKRPTRSLRLVRITTPKPVPGQALFAPVVEPMVHAQGVDSMQLINQEMGRRDDGVIVTQWLAATPSARAVHLIANLTRNGRVHWFLYLTDRVAEDETAQAVMQWDMGLLRSVVASASLANPDAAPTPAENDAANPPTTTGDGPAARPAPPSQSSDSQPG